MKGEMEEMFRGTGIDLDLSGVDVNDLQEEVFRKLFTSSGDAMSNQGEASREAPRTKKQQQREEKQRVFEDLQKKSLNGIYKQLVKTFHPDLEPDSQKKNQKEELMKKVTCAYEKKDLYTLLAIEREWMARPDDKLQSRNGQQLKSYNAILKDQVEVLQQEIRMLLLHPRYISIERFYKGQFNGIFPLKRIYEDLKNGVRELQSFVTRLQGPDAKVVLKEVIRSELMSF